MRWFGLDLSVCYEHSKEPSGSLKYLDFVILLLLLLLPSSLSSGSRDRSVGIATSYMLDYSGSIPGSVKFFLFPTASRPALGPTQPPIQLILRAPFPKVKQEEPEADH
jgi:hypothetical protein